MSKSAYQVAVLIDAGFFLHEVHAPLGQRLPEPDEISAAARSVLADDEHLFRIYYYDCPPYEGIRNNPVDQRVVNFSASATARARQSLHGRLEIAPHVAFRKGRLVFEGWTIPQQRLRELVRVNRPVRADDFRPEFTQKGVDIKIGLDVAWLASMHIVDRIILVSGDTDFVPAMKFARRQGVQVIIATVSPTVSSLLRAHSDEHRILQVGPAT